MSKKLGWTSNISLLIRQGVCTVLENHVGIFELLPDAERRHLLEVDSNKSYPDFISRIKDDINAGTYAGHLEICAASYATQTAIRVYQKIGTELKEVARYPVDKSVLHNDYHICILYTPSSVTLCGHFNLLFKDCCRPVGIGSLVTDEAIASGNIFADWQLPKHTNIGFQLSLLHYFNSSTDILSELFDDISDTSDMNEETQLHGTQVNFDGAAVT